VYQGSDSNADKAVTAICRSMVQILSTALRGDNGENFRLPNKFIY